MISTITCNLNLANFLGPTIKSIQCQNIDDVEIIVIDAKSTDESLEIIKKLSIEDTRIKYLSENDDGHFYGLNKGLKLCQGNIVGILHSSDLYEKNIFKIIKEEFENDPDLWILGGKNKLKSGKRDNNLNIKYKFMDIEDIINFRFPAIESTFFRREIFENFGNFSTNSFLKRCHTNIFIDYFLGAKKLKKKIKLLELNFGIHVEHENNRPIYSRNTKKINYYTNGRRLSSLKALKKYKDILNDSQKRILSVQSYLYDLEQKIFFRELKKIFYIEKKLFKILKFNEFLFVNLKALNKSIALYKIYLQQKFKII